MKFPNTAKTPIKMKQMEKVMAVVLLKVNVTESCACMSICHVFIYKPFGVLTFPVKYFPYSNNKNKNFLEMHQVTNCL